MYVCMYVCMYIYIYIHVYMCIHAYYIIHTYIYIYIYTLYIYICISLSLSLSLSLSIYKYIYIYMYIYTHAMVHTCIHRLGAAGRRRHAVPLVPRGLRSVRRPPPRGVAGRRSAGRANVSLHEQTRLRCNVHWP